MSENEFELYLQLLGKFLKLRPGQRVEIADELRDHLEARLEELSRGGMTRADAVRRALDEFGDAACLADHFSLLARERKKRFLMRCTLGTVSVAAVALIVVSSFWPQGAAVQIGSAPSAAWAKPGSDANEAASSSAVDDPDELVNEKLDVVRLTLELSDTPATDALEFLREKLAVDIVTRGDIAVQLNQPINLTVKHAQLSGRSALQLVLDQVGLSYIVRDGLIHVRLPQDSLAMETIDIAVLLSPDEIDGEADSSAAALIETIQRMVQPNAWDSAGGTGTITVFKGLLIVRHTPDVIGEVRRFVELLTKEIESRAKAARKL